MLLSLGRTNSVLCPVSAMLSFIAVRSSIPGPIFVSLDGCPLSWDTFVHIVREALLTGGLDVSCYSGHSFKIGAATTAARVGINDAIIKQLGRWKLSAYTAYICPPIQTLAAARSTMDPSF